MMLLKLGMLNFYLRDRNCNSQNDIVIPQYLSYHTRAHTHTYIYTYIYYLWRNEREFYFSQNKRVFQKKKREYSLRAIVCT